MGENWHNILNISHQFNTQIPLFTPYESPSTNIFKKIKLGRLATYKHPNSYKYFKSIAAINKERKQQVELSQWWIIHPLSVIRFYWEVTMTFIYAISFIIIPFMTSFVVFDYETIQLDSVSPILYAVFWLDIFMNFITGIHNKKKKRIILNQRDITKHYLRGFFAIDIMTSLPYDSIFYHWREIPGPKSYFIIAIITTIPLFKIMRYITFHCYITQLFEYYQVQNLIRRVFKILTLSFYVIYWITCLFYISTVLLMYFYQVSVYNCDCWLTQIDNTSISLRFKTACFIILHHFMTSGFDEIEADYTIYTIISSVMMIMGTIFEVYIILIFLEIYTSKNTSELSYLETINQIQAYTKHKQMPSYMKKRLEAYYFYRFKNSYFREKKILSNLSPSLRREIALHSCHNFVENTTIFRNVPQELITSIVSRLTFEIYLPNDIIVKADSQGDSMYFLGYGTVAVFTPTGREICHLEMGSYFGEVALLVQDQRRLASVIAIEVCEVYRLDRYDFRKYIATHEGLLREIERTATARIEKAIHIEEQHKRYPNRPDGKFEKSL